MCLLAATVAPAAEEAPSPELAPAPYAMPATATEADAVEPEEGGEISTPEPATEDYGEDEELLQEPESVESIEQTPLAPAQPSAARGPKKQVYGWIEDVLIDPVHTLKLPAKLDTGADTTSLDARNIRRSRRNGEDYVRFVVTEPVSGQSVELEKPFVRAVRIKAHGNDGARRVVVRMRICIGDRSRSVEVNLVDRAHYEFPLLLGRNALRDVAVIDPNLRRTREPSCWDAAEPLAAAPLSENQEPAGGAPASCENAPMC
jgi:hypothetical protein